MSPYEDIIYLPYPRKPQRMSNDDRAAQFAPFAALTGYGDAITEAGRLTDSAVELDEDERAVLNAQLRALEPGQRVTMIYFQPDDRKAGGAYIRHTGDVKKVDDNTAAVLMRDGTVIPFGRIRQIIK